MKFHSSLSRLLPLIVLAAVLLWPGCSKEKAPSGITVTFWHFWSEPAQKKALEERIAEFEKQNPDVHVEMTELSWNDGKTKLLAAFNSNTAPDMLELGSDWIAQFSSSGVLANQSGMKGDSSGRFSREILNPGMWKNALYAVPWVVDTRVLYVNKALLAAAGQDTSLTDSLWSDVMNKAEQVRAKNQQVFGFGANGPDAHRLYKKILPFFWSNGGDVVNSKGAFVVNTPENLAALEQYLELARTGVMETQKQLDQMFIQGRVAYWISGSWLLDKIKKDNPSLLYGIAPLPGFPGKPSFSFGGGEYLAINNASSKKDLAKRLVTFLSSPDQAIAFCKTLPGGMTPADLSAAGDPFLQSGTRAVFTRQMKSAKMTPVHPQWLEIEAIIEDEISKALLAEKPSKQALDDAQVRIAQLLQTDVAASDSGGNN